MQITVEIPEHLQTLATVEQIQQMVESFAQTELEKELVRQRFGEDVAELGLSFAYMRAVKQQAWNKIEESFMQKVNGKH
jgi:hypothetical protein